MVLHPRSFLKRSKKAVSPVIATVLLIAFTMSIAAILTAWVTDFTSQKQLESKKFEEKISCSGSNLEVNMDFARWDLNMTTFSIYLRNTGVNDIVLDKYLVWYDNRATPVYIDAPEIKMAKDSGSIVVINVSKGTSEFGYINISSAGEPKQVRYVTTCEGVFSQASRPMTGWNTLL